MEHKPEYADNDQTIFRKPKDRDHPYVVISKTVFEDAEISWRAKGMMGYLLSRPDDWTVILGDLVKRAPEGRGTVRTILRELEQHGYLLKRTLRDEHGRWAGVEMIVLEHPAPLEQRTYRAKNTASKTPHTEKPPTVEPPTVEPPTDNCPLLSTDVLPCTDLTKEEPATPDSPLLERIHELDSPAREQLEDYIVTLEEPRDERADSPVEDSLFPGMPQPDGPEHLRTVYVEKVGDPPQDDDSLDDTPLPRLSRGRGTMSATLRVRGDGKPQGAILDNPNLTLSDLKTETPMSPQLEELLTDPDGDDPIEWRIPKPSPHEPVEQRVARLRDELGTDPLGVAAVVEKNRAVAVHPDGGDAYHDIHPWCDAPVSAWCAIAEKSYAEMTVPTRIKLGGIFYKVGADVSATPLQVAAAIGRFPGEHKWWAEKVGFEWPSEKFCNKLGMMLVPDVEPEPQREFTFVDPDWLGAQA